MKPMLQRALMAYRPLYLNGLLLDGQYKLPKTSPPDGQAGSPCPSRSRQRTLLAALTHVVFHHRSRG
jgi:hypothetical protein